jgi:hypothetical protein
MEPTCQAFKLKTPPSISFWPLACFIWAPFNTPEHVISYSKDDPSLNIHAINNNGAPPLRASMPTPNQHASIKPGVNIGYYLYRAHNNPIILAGSTVTYQDGLCPTFDSTDNPNLFGHLFGIEFIHDSHVYVRGQSPNSKLPLAYVFWMSSPISYLTHTIFLPQCCNTRVNLCPDIQPDR